MLSRRALFVLAALLLASPLRGQVQILDEGTFSLIEGGTRVGREDFSIRAARGNGGGFVAQGNLLAGDTRRSVVLTVDSAATPVRFQMDTRRGDVVVESVLGEQSRGVWSGRIQAPGRESAREFRLPRDTFVAEQGVLHHLWFLLRLGEGRPVTMLVPSGPSQLRVVVEEGAPDRVVIAGRDLVARRWAIRRAQDGSAIWEVWTDAQGRILRALNPASGTEALRDDPPA